MSFAGIAGTGLSIAGTAVGGPIGGAIGSAAGEVLSLVSGKPHYTQGGVEYKEAVADVIDNGLEIINVENQVATYHGEPQTPVPVISSNYQDSGRLAFIAQQFQQFGVPISGSLSSLQAAVENSSIDQVLAAQKNYLQVLDSELSGSVTSGAQPQTQEYDPVPQTVPQYSPQASAVGYNAVQQQTTPASQPVPISPGIAGLPPNVLYIGVAGIALLGVFLLISGD